MKLFDYSEPYLYKDKDNKKWFVRYSISYKGEKTDYIKEYGKIYWGYSLNRIKDLKKREKEFNDLIAIIRLDLKAGIDKRKPASIEAFVNKQNTLSKKYSFDECFKLYLKLKGYDT
jgi:hypothetical protein